jgi:hypothetical protein
MISSFNDLEQFTIGWSIDQTAKKTYFDFSMSAVPGSKTAQQLVQLRDLKSQYNGFVDPKGMLSFSTVSKFSPEDAVQGRQQIEAARLQIARELEKSTEFPNEESKAAVTSLVGDLFELVNRMLDSGKTDLAASVSGAGPFTLIAGGHVGEGANLQALVDKIVKVVQIEGLLAAYDKNIAQQDGVNFHKIALNVPDDEGKIARLLGPGNVQLIVGTGKDRLYLGAGANALAAVQSAMQQSKASANTPVLPVQLTISVASVLKAIAHVDDTKADLAQLGGMLEQMGSDKVRLTYQTTGTSITARLEAEEGVIKAAGMGAAARQGNNAAF